MKKFLPGFITGTQVEVAPPPQRHFELTANELAAHYREGRGQLRLVRLPDACEAEVPVVGGHWPFIVNAYVSQDGTEREVAGIEIEDQPGWVYFLQPEEIVTLAPKE